MAKSVGIVCFVAAALFSGCCSAQTSPSGKPLQPIHRAKCSHSPAGCYEQATRDCRGGSYQILESESHAGGLLLDILPGPATWYTMSYVCGPAKPAQTVIRLPGWTGKRPPMPVNYASQDFNAQEIFRIVAPSVYFIVAGTTREASIGSAVAVAADTALTNGHVIENQTLIMVLDEATKEPLKASVSSADRSSDRCFLKVDGGSLNPIAAVRRFTDLSVGERVYTIGNPSGLSKTLGEGLISGLRQRDGIRYVQTTAQISRGSSGGALVDSKGALVGITTFLLKDAQNLNFAIAAEDYWH